MIAPQPATALIGRQAEITALTAQLMDPACRLLTLTGPAGSGKTLLAQHVARNIAPEFDDGAVWCDLATVTDVAYLPNAVAAGLGIAEQTDRPLAGTLADHLSDKHLLLVLDNCEHLLSAVAQTVAYLLPRCSRLHCLLTSLFPTGLAEEAVRQVSPLPAPDPPLTVTPAEAETYDAVRLFVARARAVLPCFELSTQNVADVVNICHRLDGLPLAIELAAARARLLTPGQIAGRLDDAFALLGRRAPGQLSRHQTLRAMMTWSFGLLSLPEQEVLQRLSVFAGSFDVEMVEGLLPGKSGVLDMLTDLLDKSLITTTPVSSPGETVIRFHLLEVVRQYAREQLQAAGQTEAAQNQLLGWAVSYATRAATELTGRHRAEWLARLQDDYPTLRAALRWAATSRQAEAGLRLAAALFRFWFLQGTLSEGRAWLEELLSPGGEPPVVRGWALFASGRLALRQWDVAEAERRGAESLALFRSADERSGVAWALSLMALVAQELNQPDQAESYYEEALAIVSRLNEPYLHSVLLHNLGLLYHERGEYGRAEALYQEALLLTRQHQLPGLGTEGNLAEILAFRGNYAAARELALANLEHARKLNDRYTAAQESLTLGQIAYWLGETAVAHRYYENALTLHRQMSTTGGIAFALAGLADVAAAEGQVEEASILYAEARQLFTQLKQAKGIAMAQVGLGRLALDHMQKAQAEEQLLLGWRQAERAGTATVALAAVAGLSGVLVNRGERREAARLLAAIEARRAALGVPAPPIDRPRLEAIASACASVQPETPPIWADLVSAYLPEESPGAPEVEPARPATEADPVMRVRLLGPVEICLNGRTVEATDWTYHKARELFFFLLAQPPADKAQIGLALWPDATTEQLRNEFHRTLYYLRRAIGHPDWVQYSQGRYCLSSTARLWCDLHEFERSMRAAQPLRRPGGVAASDRAELVAALESATGLWRGDFLADTPAGEWAIERGEPLRQVCLQALLDLGQLYLLEADYGQAERTFHRLLALDNLVEVAHRELMRCYSRQGERGRAIRHYQALSRLLQDELHTSPSPETRQLYERLHRGDDL